MTEEDKTMEFRRAIRAGDEAAVTALLRDGADPDAEDKYGGTPLTLAAGRGQTAIVERLLAAGADVNRLDGEGQSTLIMASWGGHVEIMKMLLEHGANMEVVTGATPELHTALTHASYFGRAKAVEVLLEAGANLDTLEKEESTAFDYAGLGGHKDIQQMLQNEPERRRQRAEKRAQLAAAFRVEAARKARVAAKVNERRKLLKKARSIRISNIADFF